LENLEQKAPKKAKPDNRRANVEKKLPAGWGKCHGGEKKTRWEPSDSRQMMDVDRKRRRLFSEHRDKVGQGERTRGG